MDKVLSIYARREGMYKHIEDWKNKEKSIQKLKAIYWRESYQCDDKSYDKFIQEEYENILKNGENFLKEIDEEIRKREQS